MPAATRAFFLAGLARTASGPVLAVVAGGATPRTSPTISSCSRMTLTFSRRGETLPFEHVSPNVSTMAQRAAA